MHVNVDMTYKCNISAVPAYTQHFSDATLAQLYYVLTIEESDDLMMMSCLI